MQGFCSIVFCFSVALVFCACSGEVPVPKPKGYFRIDMPKRGYEWYHEGYPFQFERPIYSKVVQNKRYSKSNLMLDMHFPNFNATLHFSYHPLKNDMKKYAQACKNLAMEHRVKATRIIEKRVKNDSTRVHGVVFDIRGNVASSYQFYVTDSIRHFLRATLYFNSKPNIDSTGPSLDYIKTDIDHLISTIRWTEVQTR